MVNNFLRIDPWWFLSKSEVISNSEAFLQEQRCPEADYFTLIHDAYTVAQNICLIHVMRREYYNATISIRF